MITTSKILTAFLTVLAATAGFAGAVTVPAGAVSADTDELLQPGEIDSCGVIGQSGTYTLTEDIDHSGASAPCFEITAGDVVLHGNGHLLSGDDSPNSSAVSVHPPDADADLADVTVRSLHVRDLGGGIVFRDVDGATVAGSTIESNDGAAVVVAGGDGATLTGNTIRDNTGKEAVYLGEDAPDTLVEENRVYRNEGHGVTFAGANNTVRDNVVYANGLEEGPYRGAAGLNFAGSSGNELAGNEVYDNAVGLRFDGAIDNVLTDDAVYDNADWDYRAVNGSTGHDVTDLRLEADGDTTVSFTRSWDVALRGVSRTDQPRDPDEFTSTGAWVEVAETAPGGYVLLNVSYSDWGISSEEEASLKLGRHDGEWTVPAGVNGVNAEDDYGYAYVDGAGVFTPLYGDGDLTPPVADAGSDQTVVAGQRASFSGSGSWDDVGIESWEWDFDDGIGRALGENETHTFDHPGTYTVTLAVEDDAGNADTDTAEVRVLASDTAAPVADAGGDVTTVAGTEATFDGAASADDVGVERYRWAFGDGTNATGAVVGHAYDEPGEYTATLTATDAAGNDDTDTLNVTVLAADTEPPAADAGEDDTTVVDTAVELSATGSTDDVGVASYEWSFGDGATATGETVSHTYDAAGTYTATLSVTDRSGNTATDTVDVTVTAADTEPPEADAGADRRVRVGRPVTLDGRGSSDDARVASYSWDFGDGGPHGHGATVSHTYSRTGTYTVTLTVADPSGNVSSTTTTVAVTENASDGDAARDWDEDGPVPGAHSVHAAISYPAPREAQVRLGNARPGSLTRFQFQFPPQADTCHALESLTVAPSRYGAFEMRVQQSGSGLADASAFDTRRGGEPFGYVTVDPSRERQLDGATLQFRLTQSCLSERGVAPDDVALYRYADGEWTELETAVVNRAGDEWRFRTRSNGTSAFAIARSAAATDTATSTATAGSTATAPSGTTEPSGGTTEPATPGGGTTTQPGFGVLVALLALLAVVLLAVRNDRR